MSLKLLSFFSIESMSQGSWRFSRKRRLRSHYRQYFENIRKRSCPTAPDSATKERSRLWWKTNKTCTFMVRDFTTDQYFPALERVSRLRRSGRLGWQASTPPFPRPLRTPSPPPSPPRLAPCTGKLFRRLRAKPPRRAAASSENKPKGKKKVLGWNERRRVFFAPKSLIF